VTLPIPNLDDRKFQDLVDECKRMIPHYAPEWTDHNVSDPGVTLIELFAWMTELLLYRVNQVPRRNYLKFLELIGVHLEPPRPARAEVTFRLTAPQPATVLIPRGTEVATQRTVNEEAIVFATERDLEITVPVMAYALVSPDEFAYHDQTPALRNPSLDVTAFDEPPRPGNGFYLGYYGDLAGHSLLLELECGHQGIGIDPRNPPLAWEYYDGNLQDWRPMVTEGDTTAGLNRIGQLIVNIPTSSRPRELDRRRATWIRVRVTEVLSGQRPYAASPHVLKVETHSLGGSVLASHSEVVSEEVVGRSDGTPGQTFRLSARPVLPRRADEALEVETDDAGEFEAWDEVEDFAFSGPDDPHYTLDSVTGLLSFGPTVRLPSGEERRHGRVPPLGRALRFTRYRIGGGVAGNVGQGSLTELKTSIPYVAGVTNLAAAADGSEAESIEGAMLRGPQVLRTVPRAVTADDFERLAGEASPEVVRARCVFARDADDGMAGSVRLVIVPRMVTTDTPVPPEQLALSDRLLTAVQDYLDARRMITVRMVLSAPTYLRVSVRMQVYPRPLVNKAQLQATVEQTLYRFIHPTAGGPDGAGWPFERPLFISDLYAVAHKIPEVEHLGTVRMLYIDEDDTPQPITGDTLTAPPGLQHWLLCSAQHRVVVV